ncbi:MAG: hypothetical protein JZU65_10715 [Chlorobium sp.]|nr:hypothetical protein [Chlorobium sp.]
MQKEQYPPTGQQEIVLSNEELRVKFPALYDWKIYSKTDQKEIVRQSTERERLVLLESRSTLNSATLEHQ